MDALAAIGCLIATGVVLLRKRKRQPLLPYYLPKEHPRLFALADAYVHACSQLEWNLSELSQIRRPIAQRHPLLLSSLSVIFDADALLREIVIGAQTFGTLRMGLSSEDTSAVLQAAASLEFSLKKVGQIIPMHFSEPLVADRPSEWWKLN